MMVGLLLYAYCLGERSSRQIEGRCRRDIAYRIICANQLPDHATIARFRADHETALGDLFNQILRLCAEAGLGKLGLVASTAPSSPRSPRCGPTARQIAIWPLTARPGGGSVRA